MYQIGGGVDLKNGASKGEITSVTFAPFVIGEGMLCDDPEGEIKITSIIPSHETISITDLCGNAYDASGIDWTQLNTNPYTLDVVPPQVATSAGSSGNGYQPTAVEGSGTAITQFYFPVTISDASGTDGIKGSFKWINGVSGEKDFKFEYVVTASADLSNDTEWQIGTTGHAHSFTQVSSGNFIHIRLLDDELYNLQSTILEIYPTDYAGNKGKTTFELDYIADRVKPAASVLSTEKSYDNALDKGTVKTSVRVTDSGGLSALYYYWGPDGSPDPDENSDVWITMGGFDEGDKSADVEIEYSGISGYFKRVLFAKARDLSGNVSISNLGNYEYDLAMPDHTLAYSEQPTEKFELEVTGLAAGNAVVVMIKKPGSDDGKYYVRVVDDPNDLEDILTLSKLGLPPIMDIYNWKLYTVTPDDDGVYDFDYIGEPDSELTGMLNGTYYGEIDVTVLVGKQPTASQYFSWPVEAINDPEVVFTNGAFIHKLEKVQPSNAYLATIVQAGTTSFPVFAKEFKLKAAPYLASVYDVSITTSDITSNSVRNYKNLTYQLTDELGFDPDDSSDDVLTTLEGLKFNISLANMKKSEWGISDIDFSKTYIAIYKANDTGYFFEPFGDKIYLAPQATQSITLPANDYPGGFYKLDLTVTTKASGKAYTFSTYDTLNHNSPNNISIFIDPTEASQNFGFAGYSNPVYAPYYGIDKNNKKYFGPIYEARDEENNPLTQYTAADNTIYIPVNSDASYYTPLLFFTADDVDVTGNNNHAYFAAYYGVKAIKAWNVTSGVDAALSKQKAAWLSAKDGGSDPASGQSYYIQTYVDNASEALDVYDSTSAYNYLPLIKNQLNTIAIQVANANGKMSEIKYVYIYPIDVRIAGTVSIGPSNNGEYVKEGKLTFTPDNGQLMDSVSVYVYDYMSTRPEKLTDITSSYDMATNSYSLVLDEPGSHLYYVYTLDTFGNYTLFDKSDDNYSNHHWAWTDSGAPTVISSSYTYEDNGMFSAEFVFEEDTVSNRKN